MVSRPNSLSIPKWGEKRSLGASGSANPLLGCTHLVARAVLPNEGQKSSPNFLLVLRIAGQALGEKLLLVQETPD